MLKATLIGNLGRDAEVKELGQRTALSLSVAHSSRRKGTDGQYHNEVVWVKATWFGYTESLAQYLVKGVMVCITGDLTVTASLDKNGQPTAYLYMSVDSLQYLMGSKKADTMAQSKVNPVQPVGTYQAPSQAAIAQHLSSQSYETVETEDLPF